MAEMESTQNINQFKEKVLENVKSIENPAET